MTTPAPPVPLPATQRQFHAVLEGCPGEWSTLTGRKASSPITVVWPGGANKPVKLGGPGDNDNLVFGQPYYPTLHQAISRRWYDGIGVLRLIAHITDIDPAGVVIGDPQTYPAALIASVTLPDIDWSSGNGAMWSVELAVGDVI